MLASRGNKYCFKSKNCLCLRAGKFHIARELLPHPPGQLEPAVFLWVHFVELSKISCPFGPIRHKRRIAGHFVLLSSPRFGRAALHPPAPSSVSSGGPLPAWVLPVEGAQPPSQSSKDPAHPHAGAGVRHSPGGTGSESLTSASFSSALPSLLLILSTFFLRVIMFSKYLLSIQ